MKKYVLKRVITAIFTLLAITLILFILMQLMPGSPFNDEKLNESQKAALYAKYGLDKPIVVQFFRYVTNMFKGDLGVSYKISKNTPITQLIASRLPISVGVGFAAVSIGALIGLLLGLLAAFKRDTAWDTLATVISVIGVSVPSYVFALALSYQFGFKLDLFPMLFSAKDVVRLKRITFNITFHVYHGFHCEIHKSGDDRSTWFRIICFLLSQRDFLAISCYLHMLSEMLLFLLSQYWHHLLLIL